LSDEEFLKKIGAIDRGDDGNLHPNIAGLVCFGDFVTIMHELPNYFLDYRERSSDSERWGDRVCSSDPTWSGNIIDFFYRIYDKVTSGIRTPFALDENDRRIDETDVHAAMREIVANALVHADYHGRQGIVIEKVSDELRVSNPGTMRISKELAVDGGRSDPRNVLIFNIFSLIGIGERSGTGLSNLYALWEKHGFRTPVIKEEFDPDRVFITVCTTGNQRGSSSIDNKQTINKLGLDNKPGIMSNLDNNKTLKDCSSLNSSARRVYAAIAADPFMTQQGLSSKLDLSRATIAAATATLIKLNFIRREGSKKTGHWEVIEKE
jgi:predicted HTH transcriptional regulator